MAEYMSERELRQRRREDREERRNELLEKELLDKEMELIRQQREQLMLQRTRERQNIPTTDQLRLRHTSDGNEYYTYDITGFDTDDVLHNSTQIREDGRQGEQNKTEVSREIEKLETLLEELGKSGLEESQRKCESEIKIRKESVDVDDETSRDSRKNYAERTGRRSDLEVHRAKFDLPQMSTSAMHDVTYPETLEKKLDEQRSKSERWSSERLKQEIKREIADDFDLTKETRFEKQVLEQERRDRHVDDTKSYKEGFFKQEQNDSGTDKLRKERLRIELEYKKREYELLLEKQRWEAERERYEERILEDRVRRNLELERREQLLEERIRTELEVKLRKQIENELREKEKKQKEILERKEKKRQEEIDLIRSIEQLRKQNIEKNLKEKEVLHLDLSEDEEERLMEERLKKLRTEKALLQEMIGSKRNGEKITKEAHDGVGTGNTNKFVVKPKLPQFDGGQFEEWQLEVKSLLETGLYTDLILSQAVRNSLVGNPRRVLLTLKPSASTKEILKKLEDIYGNIRSGDAIIHDFYSAKQLASESCAEWGIRIETLFYQALKRGEIEESRKDVKLKERFWRGLTSEQLKMATRSSYESKDSFDILRKKTRVEEVEMELAKNETRALRDRVSKEEIKLCQPIQKVSETDRKLDELLKKIRDLELDIRDIKKNQSQQGSDSYRNPRPFRGGYKPKQKLAGADDNAKDSCKSAERKDIKASSGEIRNETSTQTLN